MEKRINNLHSRKKHYYDKLNRLVLGGGVFIELSLDNKINKKCKNLAYERSRNSGRLHIDALGRIVYRMPF